MTGPKIIFFILAASIVVFSLASIFDRRILRAAIYLLFVLVAIAGLFYMMNFQFLAAVQLILYAGGIVVLIIFSILLTSQIDSKLQAPKWSHLLAGSATAIGGIALSLVTFLQFAFIPSNATPLVPDMRVIGLQLLDTGEHGYALPFEVISILLLAALVGTIYIARKSRS
ncbi:NADH-quinone oxidoreductase subunit J [uncultured Imperialibacter sp.]|uniref:NADH-quinone oxidoreductase subunit J family protein n=1 Tax=uncultured Imperialibacter sp. TaxID=1672639 RepID=UPI0030D98247|tara:strand:- start:62851 stop:63360 length:510 start_codon:yes stop_codon:yes gene_type:complete